MWYHMAMLRADSPAVRYRMLTEATASSRAAAPEAATPAEQTLSVQTATLTPIKGQMWAGTFSCSCAGVGT